MYQSGTGKNRKRLCNEDVHSLCSLFNNVTSIKQGELDGQKYSTRGVMRNAYKMFGRAN
jgi:hypothetical protein